MKRTRVCAAAACLVALCAGRSEAEGPDIRAGLAGRKAAVEALESLTCAVAVSGSDGLTKYDTTGVYRRSGDRELMSVGPAAAPTLVTCRDGSVVSTFSPSSRTAWMWTGEWNFPHDPWSAACLRRPLAALAAERVGGGGGGAVKRPVVRVRRPTSTAAGGTQITEVFDLDPGYNFAVTRSEVRRVLPGGKTLSTVSRMDPMVAVAPGVFLPGRVVTEMTAADGVVRHRLTVTISDVSVNRKVDPKDLGLRLPKGTLVSDRVKMVEYRSDAAGGPDGPAWPLVEPAPPVVPAPAKR